MNPDELPKLFEDNKKLETPMTHTKPRLRVLITALFVFAIVSSCKKSGSDNSMSSRNQSENSEVGFIKSQAQCEDMGYRWEDDTCYETIALQSADMQCLDMGYIWDTEMGACYAPVNVINSQMLCEEMNTDPNKIDYMWDTNSDSCVAAVVVITEQEACEGDGHTWRTADNKCYEVLPDVISAANQCADQNAIWDDPNGECLAPITNISSSARCFRLGYTWDPTANACLKSVSGEEQCKSLHPTYTWVESESKCKAPFAVEGEAACNALAGHTWDRSALVCKQDLVVVSVKEQCDSLGRIWHQTKGCLANIQTPAETSKITIPDDDSFYLAMADANAVLSCGMSALHGFTLVHINETPKKYRYSLSCNSLDVKSVGSQKMTSTINMGATGDLEFLKAFTLDCGEFPMVEMKLLRESTEDEQAKYAYKCASDTEDKLMSFHNHFTPWKEKSDTKLRFSDLAFHSVDCYEKQLTKVQLQSSASHFRYAYTCGSRESNTMVKSTAFKANAAGDLKAFKLDQELVSCPTKAVQQFKLSENFADSDFIKHDYTCSTQTYVADEVVRSTISKAELGATNGNIDSLVGENLKVNCYGKPITSFKIKFDDSNQSSKKASYEFTCGKDSLAGPAINDSTTKIALMSGSTKIQQLSSLNVRCFNQHVLTSFVLMKDAENKYYFDYKCSK